MPPRVRLRSRRQTTGPQSSTRLLKRPGERPRVAKPQPSEGGSNAARKGDRLVRATMVALTKQSFRAPVTQKVGEREVIKVRPFVRVATGLSLTTGTYATDIPAYDPLKLFAGEAPERMERPDAGEGPDAEVTVVKRDLAEVAVPDGAAALTLQPCRAGAVEQRFV